MLCPVTQLYDLHEVVDLGALADPRAAKAGTVDGGAGPISISSSKLHDAHLLDFVVAAFTRVRPSAPTTHLEDDTVSGARNSRMVAFGCSTHHDLCAMPHKGTGMKMMVPSPMRISSPMTAQGPMLTFEGQKWLWRN